MVAAKGEGGCGLASASSAPSNSGDSTAFSGIEVLSSCSDAPFVFVTQASGSGEAGQTRKLADDLSAVLNMAS